MEQPAVQPKVVEGGPVYLAPPAMKGAVSPFKKASESAQRIKAFFWGDSGSGKTTLALNFPKVAMIDMEGGTKLYDKIFNFERLSATTTDEVMEAVDWLLTNKHDFSTLVIDPISIYYEALQKKWSDIFMKRSRSSKGYRHEFYEFQPRDWGTLKSEQKELMRKLLRLDMNVIITARQKIKYSEEEFMKKAGEIFDAEKSMPYFFDMVVHLYRDDKGRFKALCSKDRSNKLPREEFEVSYAHFEAVFGGAALAREAEEIHLATSEQVSTIETYIKEFQLSQDQVRTRLAAYDAEAIEDLTTGNAGVIIEKFKAAVAKKQGGAQ